MKRILCIRLPNWPIQRLSVAQSALKDRPLVLRQAQRGVERVAACCAQAATMGIAVGMPIAEVQATGKELNRLAAAGTAARRKQPTPRILPYDATADREALEALAEHCGRFSPTVGLEQSAEPDSLLLDLTGVARLFGGEAVLAEKIIAEFTRRGLTMQTAVADTVAAAYAVAHFHSSFIIQHSSFLLIPPGETAAALRPLPVAALRLPPEVVDVLHQLGIDRIGQLERLPRDGLSSRFGPQLLTRLDQAAGRLVEPVVAHRPSPKFTAGRSLDYPTAGRKTVEAVLELLIRRVATKLAQCGHGAVHLECRLDCGAVDPVRVSLGLFEPTASAEHLFRLVQLQLERLRLPGPVTDVHVAATAILLPPRQQEMFSDDCRRRSPQHLATLIDRLSSRLGRRAVLGVRPSRDAQPELAWQYDPLVGSARRGRLRGKFAAGLPPRPLRLLRRPIALTATSAASEGPPRQFHLRGRGHRVAHTWGPERIETGWWRGRAAGRDYCRIETTEGRRFWLFRRLRDGKWFVHGMFE